MTIRRKLRFLACANAAVGSLFAAPARADTGQATPAKATFAIIVGSNQSVDRELPPLRYADDDAARYQELFRVLGARTHLVTRLDENTKRLHPQAAAEAIDPTRAQFEKALSALTDEVVQAKARNVETIVYFVYAGHGNVKNGQGYITLEDAQITGGELASIVARIPAARIHIVVDACASYFLAYGRGPGGDRRAVQSFRVRSLADDPRVGLLLSTSSARESHEWDAYQSGVFSHEVRSGLYGAADADGDGLVSYREIAAFVARANAAIPNERFRPEIFTQAPKVSATLVDFANTGPKRLRLDGEHAGRYFLEDSRGVRLADAHNAIGQSLSLLIPAQNGKTYLRRLDDDKEFIVEGERDELAVADLTPQDPRAHSRGAAHEAFGQLFTLPFNQATVADYRESPPPKWGDFDIRDNAKTGGALRIAGWSSIGVGILGVGLGTFFAVRSTSASNGASSSESQADAAKRNHDISANNTRAAVSFVAGGAAIAGGAVMLFWPEIRQIHFSAAPQGVSVGYEKSF